MRPATVLAVLLVIAGCQTRAPVVTRSDGTFVTITQPRGDSQRSAKDLADQTCGKHAVEITKLCVDSRCREEELKFWCR